jgi:transposase-like protein
VARSAGPAQRARALGLRLVVADAHAGLAKAVRKHLPEAPLQRCTVHLQRNVLTKAPQRLRSRLAKAVPKSGSPAEGTMRSRLYAHPVA